MWAPFGLFSYLLADNLSLGCADFLIEKTLARPLVNGSTDIAMNYDREVKFFTAQ